MRPPSKWRRLTASRIGNTSGAPTFGGIIAETIKWVVACNPEGVCLEKSSVLFPHSLRYAFCCCMILYCSDLVTFLNSLTAKYIFRINYQFLTPFLACGPVAYLYKVLLRRSSQVRSPKRNRLCLHGRRPRQ